ncbi:hypothetical protein O1611_g4641 [Lasiodiplodia mahajangana]|uniref:Uncharacterized protein n=1 Tax=Lasiodiplodia mahajangana TaxID=1108764 RepID=A0ACC2JN98_9PEZI|nr:hypothetical protein O1611_g4641 [Lasiodiplodia mahajangana]
MFAKTNLKGTQGKLQSAAQSHSHEKEPNNDEPKPVIDPGPTGAGEMLLGLHVDDSRLAILNAGPDQVAHELYGLVRDVDEYMDVCNWDKKDTALLWIRGTAEQGKTMLIKSIIRELSEASHNDSTIQCPPFFLFDSLSPDANNAAAAVRTLIWGILVRQPNLNHHLRSKLSGTGRKDFDDPNDFPALSGILYDIIKDPVFPETYFIIDSLDECSSEPRGPGLTDLLEFIEESIQVSDRIRWIFSGATQLALSKNKKCVTIDMDSLDCSNAINSYIQREVGVLAKAKAYDKDLENTVVTTLCDRSPGNYLQVDLICQVLKSEERWHAESVLDEVKALNDLDLLYEYVEGKFAYLPRGDGELCSELLRILAVINQPLKFDELEELVFLGPRVDLRGIVERCNCFLRVSDEGCVSFRHQTARKYVGKRVKDTFQVYASIINRGIDSLAGLLTGDIHKEHSTPNSFISLAWIGYLCDMVNEAVASNESEEALEIYAPITKRVLKFLKENFVTWLEALSSRGLLARAAILLRKADLLLDAKCDPKRELCKAIREAHIVTSRHTWMETPKHISAHNTMLTEGIPKTKYLQNAASPIELLQLGSVNTRLREFGCLEGHRNWVRSIAFSLDGRLMASSDDRSVRIWDAEMGTTQHTLEIGEGLVYSLAFSSKGHIAAGSDDGSIHIWDSSSGRHLRTVDQQETLHALVFSPDGRYLAAVSPKILRIWNFDTQDGSFHDIEHHSPNLISVSCSWDGKLLAGGDDGKIHIWDSWREPEPGPNKSPLLLDGHTCRVNSVAFSPKTRPGYFASGSDDNTVKIWRLDNDKAYCVLTLESGILVDYVTVIVDSITFSPNGLQLAAVINGRIICIWDVVEGGKLGTMRLPDGPFILSAAFSPTGAYLASGFSNGRVYLWYPANEYVGRVTGIQRPVVYEPICELTVAPDGRTIAAGHKDGKVTLWNMDGENVPPTEMLPAHSARVSCLAFSSDGLSLASSSKDKSARVYDVATREMVACFDSHTEFVPTVAWSPGDKYLASGSGDNSVRVYRIDNQSKSWVEVQAMIHSETFLGCVVPIYATNTHGVSTTSFLRLAQNFVTAVAFSPHESRLYLAAGDNYGQIVVWEQVDRKWVRQHVMDTRTHRLGRDRADSIVFTPDGERLVSAGDVRNLRVWDFKTPNSASVTIRTPVKCCRVRFERGQETSEYVMTDTGAQSIDPSIGACPDWCPYGYCPDERGAYLITWHGQEAILIPERLVPTVRYFMGNKHIIGTENGHQLCDDAIKQAAIVAKYLPDRPKTG